MEGITYAQIIMTFVSAVATTLIAWLGRKLERKEKERDRKEASQLALQEAVREGMQAILRDRIMQMSSYCIERGSTQVYMVENMEHMFSAYEELGGNGAVRHIYDQFMTLPVTQNRRTSQGGDAR